MKEEKIPSHVAIIMDGNGRWAIKKGFTRNKGHREGAENLMRIALYANKRGIKTLTVFAFSTENWSRPAREVNYLMKLPIDFFRRYLPRLKKNNIKVDFIGSHDKLSPELLTVMHEVSSMNNDGLNLVIALNYGGRDEIIRAVKGALDSGLTNLDQATLASFLDTKAYPDVDLLIRTSGELRISNFLLWQSAYSELYFTDILWPEFSTDDFEQAIIEYQKRHRRYGGL